MNIHSFSFEDLDVYKEARQLVKDVYLLQRRFPTEERFALGDQVRRAATSVTANIAEGSGRSSVKEKIHFIEISYGSLMETYSELHTAQDLGYLTEADIDAIRPRFVKVAKMLSGLRASFQRQLPNP